MYGAVPLREIKRQLLELRAAGKLDRVKVIMLTNCTFDGVVYDVERVMQECLAIKPDLVFLWDEAWFAFARFHPIYRSRTAMAGGQGAARTDAGTRLPAALRGRGRQGERRLRRRELLDMRLIPDPARTRIRVYATQSTHKTLTSLRQGSMIHVFDQDFGQKVEETFHEAYMTHTSTSPNYQILASLDLGRRQVDARRLRAGAASRSRYAMRLRDAVRQPPAAAQVHAVPDDRRSDPAASTGRPASRQPLRSGLKNMCEPSGATTSSSSTRAG